MSFSLTTQNGDTAVDSARKSAHTDVVDILVKEGADANPMVL